MWDLLNAAWFGLLVGTAFGIVGLWFGVYSYRQSRQISRLRYMEGHTPLMGPSPVEAGGRLRILFDEVDVARLTSSSFGIWNDGTTTIRGDDIVRLDPLVVRVAGGAILRASIEAATRHQTDVRIEEKIDHVALSFDYLDPGDGFRVQVLHSGQLDAAELSGSIRGLPHGVVSFVPDAAAKKWFIGFLGSLMVLAAVASIAMFGWVAYMIYSIPWPANVPLLGFCAVMVFAVAMIVLRPPTGEVPVRRIKGVPDIISNDTSLH